MFVSSGQFYVFLAAVSIGVLSGPTYTVGRLIAQKINNKTIEVLSDVFFFISLAIFYSVLAYRLKFPSLRAYILLGVLLGVIIYIKSLHSVLANLIKRVYNLFRKKLKKTKE